MTLDRHWHDEALVDGVLHKLSAEHTQELMRHLETCERCSRRYMEWEALLDHDTVMAVPSSSLKQRLIQRATREQRKKRLSKRKKAFVSIGMAASIVLVVLLLNVQPITPPNDFTAIQNDNALQAPFVNDPHTSLYNVVPVSPTNIRGDVWVNDTSKEMLIFVEGLVPRAHKDYQIWFVDTDGRYSDKVLELQDDKAVLYLQGDGVKRIQHVRSSLEPKGGSPVPTGMDTFIVDLQR